MNPLDGSAALPALRRWLYLDLGLLAAQFASGMWVNLFGSYPEGIDTFGGTFLYKGDPLLLVHLTVAALLLGATLATGTLAVSRSVPAGARILVISGVLGVALAAVGGYFFLSSGFSSDQDSYLMAIGCLIAILGFALAISELPSPPLRLARVANPGAGGRSRP